MNGFIERERERLQSIIAATPETDPGYQPLHAAQQALAWASDPDAYASPTVTLKKFFDVGGDDGTKGTGVTNENRLGIQEAT